ncbi:MAG: hypothetical protein AB8B80_12260 [Marinicellaceae bacterium]
MKNIKKRLKVFVLTLTAFVITPSVNAVVTVGNINDGCDYDNLLDAYLDNDPVVHVTTQLNHFDSFVIAKTKYFIGGFETCENAKNNEPGNNKSVWRKSGNETVVKINANQVTKSIISFSNFEIYGGEDVTFAGTGGISIQGNSSVSINNSSIYNNSGDLGGGIQVFGSDVELEINQSEIRNNIAMSAGGGIYCESGATVIIQNESAIKNNISHDNGGGVYAISNCDITLASGDSLSPLMTSQGILGNIATNYGGGIYAASESRITLDGGLDHPASVTNNRVSVSRIPFTGGGIYASDFGTFVSATNARIDSNFTPRFGAGLAIDNQAVFIMNRSDLSCWDNHRCSSLSDNYTDGNDSGAAAGGFNNAAFVQISRTLISGNKANSSAVFSMGSATDVTLEGNVIVKNTSNSQPFSAELFSLFGSTGNGANLSFLYNTVSNNITDNIFKLFGQDSEQSMNVLHSIIDDNGEILATTGNLAHNILWGCLIVHENQSLMGSIFQTFVLNPLLNDIQNDDYRLSSNSPAIDFCDNSITQASYNDFNNQPRGIDDEDSQNFIGIYDLGAYEYQNIDLIFRSRFE